MPVLDGDKHTRLIWLAAAGAVCAWPLGELIGALLSAGQDGPGRALAGAFGGFATFAIWGISTAIIIWNPGQGLERLGKGARIIVAVSIVVLPVATIASIASRQSYDLRVWNETGARIDDVVVRFNGKRYSFGAMREDVSASIGFQQHRPEGRARVMWTGVDGRAHEAVVDLSDMVPGRYNNGVLTFTIEAGGDVRTDFFIRKEPLF